MCRGTGFIFLRPRRSKNLKKGEKIVKDTNNMLREKVRLCKAYSPEWNYVKMAELLQVSKGGFYNWMAGQYDLSPQKQEELKGILFDLMDA